MFKYLVVSFILSLPVASLARELADDGPEIPEKPWVLPRIPNKADWEHVGRLLGPESSQKEKRAILIQIWNNRELGAMPAELVSPFAKAVLPFLTSEEPQMATIFARLLGERGKGASFEAREFAILMGVFKEGTTEAYSALNPLVPWFTESQKRQMASAFLVRMETDGPESVGYGTITYYLAELSFAPSALPRILALKRRTVDTWKRRGFLLALPRFKYHESMDAVLFDELDRANGGWPFDAAFAIAVMGKDAPHLIPRLLELVEKGGTNALPAALALLYLQPLVEPRTRAYLALRSVYDQMKRERLEDDRTIALLGTIAFADPKMDDQSKVLATLLDEARDRILNDDSVEVVQRMANQLPFCGKNAEPLLKDVIKHTSATGLVTFLPLFFALSPASSENELMEMLHAPRQLYHPIGLEAFFLQAGAMGHFDSTSTAFVMERLMSRLEDESEKAEFRFWILQLFKYSGSFGFPMLNRLHALKEKANPDSFSSLLEEVVLSISTRKKRDSFDSKILRGSSPSMEKSTPNRPPR